MPSPLRRQTAGGKQRARREAREAPVRPGARAVSKAALQDSSPFSLVRPRCSAAASGVFQGFSYGLAPAHIPALGALPAHAFCLHSFNASGTRQRPGLL
jgi:hypothetical protein